MLGIGFDMGGTSIKSGLLEVEGDKFEILAQVEKPLPETNEEDRGVQICKLLSKMAEELLKKTGLERSTLQVAGLSTAGSIDERGERIVNAYNLGLHDVPMKKMLEQEFPLSSVALINDAHAACLAELNAGALRGCKNGIMLTLGTAIGGRFVINGEVFKGGLGHGTELAHMTFDWSGPNFCSCGNNGCFEAVCGLNFFKRKGISPKEAFEKAGKGEKAEAAVVEEYIALLGSGIASLASCFDPERIVIGGGIAKAGNDLFVPLTERVAERNFFKYRYEITPALLGNKAGFIGAIFAALPTA